MCRTLRAVRAATQTHESCGMTTKALCVSAARAAHREIALARQEFYNGRFDEVSS